MYRKYIQELSANGAAPHTSTDPVFPDTNLIVGEAQLKAARAGAAHRDHCNLPSISTMAATPSSAGMSDTHTSHTTVSDPPVTLHGRGQHLTEGEGDADSDNSITPPSPPLKGVLATASQSAGGSTDSDTRSLGGGFRGLGRSKDSRRHSEIFQLHDFVSRSNTPEFRRRPTTATQLRPATHTSPPRVSEDDGFATLSQDEVIVVRPVSEASRARSPLYPTPRGDLILHHNHGQASAAPHSVIKVISAPKKGRGSDAEAWQVTEGREGAALPSHHHLSNHLHTDGNAWTRPTPRASAASAQRAQPRTAGPSIYSVLCCRAHASGR